MLSHLEMSLSEASWSVCWAGCTVHPWDTQNARSVKSATPNLPWTPMWLACATGGTLVQIMTVKREFAPLPLNCPVQRSKISEKNAEGGTPFVHRALGDPAGAYP